jgi:hypothetical protein
MMTVFQEKIKRRKELIQQAAPNVKFTVEEEPISRTSSFKYLGQIITENDDDLPAVGLQIKRQGRFGQG